MSQNSSTDTTGTLKQFPLVIFIPTPRLESLPLTDIHKEKINLLCRFLIPHIKTILPRKDLGKLFKIHHAPDENNRRLASMLSTTLNVSPRKFYTDTLRTDEEMKLMTTEHLCRMVNPGNIPVLVYRADASFIWRITLRNFEIRGSPSPEVGQTCLIHPGSEQVKIFQW